MTIFDHLFFFSKFLEVPELWGTYFTFSAQFAKRSNNKNLVVRFTYRPKIYKKNSTVRVLCYCSSNKVDLVQFFKIIFPLSRIEDYPDELWSFFAIFYRIFGDFTFIEYEECLFNDHFKRFHHFWLGYHNLIFVSACFKSRTKSE